MKRVVLLPCLLAVSNLSAHAQWAALSKPTVKLEPSEMGGPAVVVDYEVKTGEEEEARNITPVYVFLRYSRDGGQHWQLLPARAARGDNLGVVSRAGRKRVVIWGAANLGLDNLETLRVAVRGIPMARVPAGKFNLKLVPGAGYDQSKTLVETAELPAYCLTRGETTLAMYADFLNEPGRGGAGWHEKMKHPERCGIEKDENGQFRVIAGRELYPVTYVSWYHASAFLDWCGLRLPTEAEFVKAMRGGYFLDGDEARQKANPMPDRKYPWGSEAPDAGGVWRCNVDGEQDGFGYTAPVGSFAKFNSPYGIADLVGNAAEWTQDWYATSYHAGLDGYRMVRGGSWMEAPATCDGTTGATSLPVKESGIVGFRGACDAEPRNGM